MRLVNLAWEPRARKFIAVTDVGTFLVPNMPGGWSQREAWPYSAVFRPVANVAGWARLLGMASPAPPRLGGCGCLGRRT